MSNHKFIRNVALAATLIVLPATGYSPFHFNADQALAGNGNGNGGGNGNGNGGGNGNSGGNGGGQSASASKAAAPSGQTGVASEKKSPKSLKEFILGSPKKKTTVAAVSKKPTAEKRTASKIKPSDQKLAGKQKVLAVASIESAKKEKSSKGAMASKLGALNAAHASPNAFANAAPNSRIGLIRTYFVANAEVIKAKEDAAEASKVLDEAKAALAEATTLQKAIDDAVVALKALNIQLTEAQAAIFGLDETDPAFIDGTAAIAALKGEITTAESAQLTAEAKMLGVDLPALQVAADKAATEFAAAEKAVEENEIDALAALEAAANKTPVTPEVRVALDKLLDGKIVLEETASTETTPTEVIVTGGM